MEQTNWKVAADLIRERDQASGDALSKLLESEAFASIEDSPAVLEYRYGEPVFERGSLKLPRESTVTLSRYREGALCLGIILENTCEVLARQFLSARFDDDVAAPEAVLSGGDWLGLFELLDLGVGVPEFQSPDWNITAGCTSIFAAARINTGKARGEVRKTYHITEPPDGDGLFKLVAPILGETGVNPSWRTRILFLPVQFLRLLQNEAHTARRSYEVLELYSLLYERGWKNLARIRNSAQDEVSYLIKEANPATADRDVIEAAAKFAAYLLLATSSRAPAYVATLTNESHGPFKDISKVLSALKLPPTVLYPTYLAPGQVGFFRLEDVDRNYFVRIAKKKGIAHEDAAKRMIRLIIKTQAMKPKEGVVNHINKHHEVFQSLMFRVPATGGGKVKKPPKLLKISFVDKKIQELSHDDEFFASAFAGQKYPGSRCPFFTAAVRVQG